MERGSRRGELWAIVLAAGEGTRLASVTRVLYGKEVPKQFAALTGERTLLQMTLDRIAALVPPSRTVVVVSEAHRGLAELQLADYAGVEIVAQPLSRGTAVGALLPLAHVLARDPQAQVLIFPSDHHIVRPTSFHDAARRALLAAEEAPSGTALVGAAAESAATDLGWIVPERSLAREEVGAARVARFVEKPPAATAMELLEAGALWNTLVIAANGSRFWKLARRRLPAVTAGFDRYRNAVGRQRASAVMRALYQQVPSADLSRDILERSPRGLAVVALIDAGWSDCGTPERLLRCLHDNGHARHFREHLERAHRSASSAVAVA
jgi:mannose-1-phosphate guanylyltransferase